MPRAEKEAAGLRAIRPRIVLSGERTIRSPVPALSHPHLVPRVEAGRHVSKALFELRVSFISF